MQAQRIELRLSNETAKLVHAASLSLKTSGKRDIAPLLDKADKSPSRVVKFHRLSEVAESMEIVQTCLWPPTENVSGGCTCTSFALQLAKTGLHRHPTFQQKLQRRHTLFLFYKNQVYKNVRLQIIKNLRTC